MKNEENSCERLDGGGNVHGVVCNDEISDMKNELKQTANRHAIKLVRKLREVMTLPEIAEDSIRKELEYATLDGYRETMKYINRNGDKHGTTDGRFTSH